MAEALNEASKTDKRKAFSEFLTQNAPTAEQQIEVTKSFLMQNQKHSKKSKNISIEQ